MKSVYLAGPITGLSYEQCTEWRRQAAEWLESIGIHPLDPLRGKEFLSEIKRMSGSEIAGTLTTDHAITLRDRHDVYQCDLVLANLTLCGEEDQLIRCSRNMGNVSVEHTSRVTVASPGTMIEFGWADAWRKPIIAVLPLGAGNPHDRGLVRGVATFIVPTLEQALELVAMTLAL